MWCDMQEEQSECFTSVLCGQNKMFTIQCSGQSFKMFIDVLLFPKDQPSITIKNINRLLLSNWIFMQSRSNA
jgi:hypothetical protein